MFTDNWFSVKISKSEQQKKLAALNKENRENHPGSKLAKKTQMFPDHKKTT